MREGGLVPSIRAVNLEGPSSNATSTHAGPISALRRLQRSEDQQARLFLA